MPTFTAPNAQPYSSALMPLATRSIVIKRGDGSTAGGGSTTTIGTFLVENENITTAGKLVRRMGTQGEATDMAIVRDANSYSGKIQIKAATGQGTPLPGDYFEDYFENVAAGTLEASKRRFVLTSISKDATAGSPWTYSLSATEDIENSPIYTS